MTKWSVVTNIHWKLEGFWAGSYGATKVYNLPFRFKDGVDAALGMAQIIYRWNTELYYCLTSVAQ